jgi:hypothetical protein
MPGTLPFPAQPEVEQPLAEITVAKTDERSVKETLHFFYFTKPLFSHPQK